MGTITQRGSGHQLRIKNRLLAKPWFHTFDTREEAELQMSIFESMLKGGVVPQELLAVTAPTRGSDPLLIEVIREYTKKAPITKSDDDLLTVVVKELPGLRLSHITVHWAEDYVTLLKLKNNLKPGTIRKRVGTLARVLDWHLRRSTAKGTAQPSNPLRGLPTGYSAYTPEETARLPEGKEAKEDVQRDRRFEPGDEDRIRFVLGGGKMPGKRKGLKKEPEFELLYDVILDTGARLQEAYLLRVDQLQLDQGFIGIEGSKGARGKIKHRTVPIRPALIEKLRKRVEVIKTGRLFPWFEDGKHQTKKQTSAYLSKRFAQMFAYAEVIDFTEHDLRHEATCRWVTLRRADGHWAFSDAEIAKIMGWSSMAMMLRYLSLRGSDLANRFV